MGKLIGAKTNSAERDEEEEMEEEEEEEEKVISLMEMTDIPVVRAQGLVQVSIEISTYDSTDKAKVENMVKPEKMQTFNKVFPRLMKMAGWEQEGVVFQQSQPVVEKEPTIDPIAVPVPPATPIGEDNLVSGSALPAGAVVPGAPAAGLVPAAPPAGLVPGAPAAGLVSGAPVAGLVPGALAAGIVPAAPPAGIVPAAPPAGLVPAAPPAGLVLPAAPPAGLFPAAPPVVANAPANQADGAITKQLQASLLRGPDDWDLTISNSDSAHACGQCSANSECVQSKCYCKSGWKGDACSIKSVQEQNQL